MNNSRFLLLPEASVPNLGSRVLALTLERLSQDWQNQYGHPVEVVETFVDPDQFCVTVYTASGWIELGQTDGWGRQRRDYYVKHYKPKRLFVRALHPQSCRSLQAEHLNVGGGAKLVKNGRFEIPVAAARKSVSLARLGRGGSQGAASLHPASQGNSLDRRALQTVTRLPAARGVLSAVQPGRHHSFGHAL